MDNKVVIVKGDKSAFEVKIYQDDELYTLKTNEHIEFIVFRSNPLKPLVKVITDTNVFNFDEDLEYGNYHYRLTLIQGQNRHTFLQDVFIVTGKELVDKFSNVYKHVFNGVIFKTGAKGDKGDSVDLSGYYTKVEVDDNFAKKKHKHTIGDVNGLETQLESKANVDDVYTKTESDTRFAPKQHTHEISDVTGLSDELESSGLTLVNLIENGDFSDGATGWVAGSNMTMEITGNGVRLQTSSPYPNINQSVTLTPAIYYFVFNSVDTIVPERRFLQLNTVQSVPLTPANQGFYSGRFVSVVPATRIYINHINSELVAIDYIITNMSLINLTQTFGAGNEPTKEEMDLLIETLGVEYFEEVTVTKLQAINWLLKLIRQNALATTSLGGTIL